MHPVLRSWLLGMRPWSLPISIVPIVLAATIVFMDPYPSLDQCEAMDTLYRWEFMACLVGGMSIHAGANLLNTYHDFKSGVDTKRSADDRTLVDKTMRPNEVRYLGMFLFALATSWRWAVNTDRTCWSCTPSVHRLSTDPFSLRITDLVT